VPPQACRWNITGTYWHQGGRESAAVEAALGAAVMFCEPAEPSAASPQACRLYCTGTYWHQEGTSCDRVELVLTDAFAAGLLGDAAPQASSLNCTGTYWHQGGRPAADVEAELAGLLSDGEPPEPATVPPQACV